MTQSNVKPLLTIQGLNISFGSNNTPPTVDQVDLTIAKGQTVALVGESGSGKSLLAHAIAGILHPHARLTADCFAFGGVNLLENRARTYRDLRGREIGIVFQNPRAALNPVLRIGEQIADVIHEHRGLRGKKLRDAVVEALASVRIPEPALRARAYVGEMSGGMCQRVMIAMALSANPSLLIADEPTTGLDTTTQAAIIDLLVQSAQQRAMATLLITHDLALARSAASVIVVMHAGQVVERAPAAILFESPKHPYSAALLGATLAQAESVQQLVSIPGVMPDIQQASACRFAKRCPRVTAQCRQERPPLQADPESPDHYYACWKPL